MRIHRELNKVPTNATWSEFSHAQDLASEGHQIKTLPLPHISLIYFAKSYPFPTLGREVKEKKKNGGLYISQLSFCSLIINASELEQSIFLMVP